MELWGTLSVAREAFQPFVALSSTVSDEDLSRALDAVSRTDAIFGARDALASSSLARQRDLLVLFQHTRNELRRMFPGDFVQW